MSRQQLIDYIAARRVLILGFGREGRSSLAFIRRALPELPVAVADKLPQSVDDPLVTVFSGEDYLSRMGGFDLVLKSPGISFRGVRVPDGVEVSCQTDLFMRFAPCVKAGVTGTKGKTTTSALIFEMLRASGIPALLMGNMGLPVFDEIDSCEGKTAVVELSSHQLEFMTASPHVAVLTNIYEEHLDHYDGLAGYVAAKLNIARFQKEDDCFLFNAEQGLCGFADPECLPAKKIAVGKDDGGDPLLRSLAGTGNGRLLGEHNRHNIFFACAAARLLGAQNGAMLDAVRGFEGIDHRMQPVGTFHGIRFVNDCIATIPHSVLCALDALGDTDTLIFGGMDRGIDYSGFLDGLEERGVRNLIGLPDTGHTIGRELTARGSKKNILLAADMEDAVSKAFAVTEKGKSCLLSPAAPSYNVYRDFEEKGAHFMNLVKNT